MDNNYPKSSSLDNADDSEMLLKKKFGRKNFVDF